MGIKSFLKDLRKTTNSETFATSKLGIISDWIDTGDYGLNRIISGDIYKGIPSGRVLVIGGESQSAKSFIAAQIAANALNKENYDMVLYFDSEGGGLKDFFENRGCNPEKIEHILLESVEDATVKILNTYKKLEKYKNEDPDSKFLCILDSLGNLIPTKLITDAEKGKQKSDQGGRAKLVNNMIKGMTVPALKTNTSMIIINHIYDDPTSMFPSKIKNQGGGKGTQYNSQVTIQCSKRYEKSENSNDDKFYGASILKFFTTKNRLVKPFYETEMFLDFSKGPLKYHGLLEPAKKYGFIRSPKQGWYNVPSYGDKQLRLKELLLDNGTIWNTFLDDLNEKFKEEMSYSGNMEKETEEFLESIED